MRTQSSVSKLRAREPDLLLWQAVRSSLYQRQVRTRLLWRVSQKHHQSFYESAFYQIPCERLLFSSASIFAGNNLNLQLAIDPIHLTFHLPLSCSRLSDSTLLALSHPELGAHIALSPRAPDSFSHIRPPIISFFAFYSKDPSLAGRPRAKVWRLSTTG